MFHFCVFVSLSVNAVKLRAPVGPNNETDCSTRRCACRGVGQVRVFIVTRLVTMVTVQSPRVQSLCHVIHKCRVFAFVYIPHLSSLMINLFVIAVVAFKLHLCVIVCLRYILDLNKEQEADFAKKVTSMALEAGFEQWHEGKSDDVHAVFIPRKK